MSVGVYEEMTNRGGLTGTRYQLQTGSTVASTCKTLLRADAPCECMQLHVSMWLNTCLQQREE